MAWEVRWAVAKRAIDVDPLFGVPTSPMPMVGDIIERDGHRWRVTMREFKINTVDECPVPLGPPVGTVYSNVIVFVEPVP